MDIIHWSIKFCITTQFLTRDVCYTRGRIVLKTLCYFFLVVVSLVVISNAIGCLENDLLSFELGC